jgi:ribose transport system substrate-binding protein
VAWNAEGFEKLENKDTYMQAYLMPDPNETAKMLDVIKDALDGKQISETVFQDYYMADQDTISNFDWRSIVAMRAKYN